MMTADFRIYSGPREQSVGSFGERLRREREMRGISLDEIATATKISARNLRALEDEKFSQLPGGIFNKGFVRAYAKFLGIDEEQIVAEYEAASQETEAAREQKLKEEFSKAEFRKQRRDGDQEISLEPKSQWGTIAIIVLIAALAYVGYSYYQRKKLERQQRFLTPVATQAAPAQSQASAPPPLPSASIPEPAGNQLAPANAAEPQQSATEKNQGEQPASQKTETPSAPTDSSSSSSAAKPIELKIKVNKTSWISIVADGKTLVSSTLEPGTERTFKASDKIEMVLGNAGGVEISYNGKTVENPGTGQDVRKITFTPSGYE
jgi:cytoskeleton protein RodZ